MFLPENVSFDRLLPFLAKHCCCCCCPSWTMTMWLCVTSPYMWTRTTAYRHGIPSADFVGWSASDCYRRHDWLVAASGIQDDYRYFEEVAYEETSLVYLVLNANFCPFPIEIWTKFFSDWIFPALVLYVFSVLVLKVRWNDLGLLGL